MTRVVFLFAFALLLGAILLSFGFPPDRRENLPLQKLSEYGFFQGEIALQQPVTGVIPYFLNTPLFSDYAEKLRFVKLPEGEMAVYNDSVIFDFPVGTVLIKTFFFPADFRVPSRQRKLIETRLLVHEAKGWKAYPYIWNEEQTDAFLEIAGDAREVVYINSQGKKQRQTYFIPNTNQCKGCHNHYEQLVPIGPTARQLNGEHTYGYSVAMNQLAFWQSSKILKDLPSLNEVPKAPIWNDPSSGTLDERARIWLDINCAHCHNPGGPAVSSGLNLQYTEKDPLKIGIGKTPVAAGRGSGNRQFDIVPGDPEASILLFRMASTDPGIMMPELGRTLHHREGYELIQNWIRQMH